VAFKCRAIAASVRWAEYEVSIVYVRAALALARRLLVRLIGDRHGERISCKAARTPNLFHKILPPTGLIVGVVLTTVWIWLFRISNRQTS
jgi:hypothetical protein